MKFPIYRKYSHNRTYFKITSEKNFEELNIIGKTYSLHNFQSKILPDRLFIQDMIDNRNNHWDEISEEEYDQKKTYCTEKLQKV